MCGGEVAAMAIMEATVRLIPGVLGNGASVHEESHSPGNCGLLEYPQFTRPVEFRGIEVPAILTSGDHGKIAAWRRDQSLERTRARRPDLYEPIFAQLQQAEELKKSRKRRR
jgi:tRNA (guanine37-N1)-methyltransferase